MSPVRAPRLYLIPHTIHFHSKLHGQIFFSKIDLVHAFHQILVVEKDIPKTPITTPFGLFDFTMVIFCLRNDPQTFKKFLSQFI